MTLTWRDAAATAVVGAFAVGFVGLAQDQSWAPVTSLRWFALLFVVVGQATCAVTAADAMAAGVTKGAGFVLGPIALVAGLLALVTGSVAVLGVGVVAMVGLWVLTTSRHMIAGHHGVGHERVRS